MYSMALLKDSDDYSTSQGFEKDAKRFSPEKPDPEPEFELVLSYKVPPFLFPAKFPPAVFHFVFYSCQRVSKVLSARLNTPALSILHLKKAIDFSVTSLPQ